MTSLIQPNRHRKVQGQVPYTQANFDSLVALLQRILAATRGGAGGRKKLLAIQATILGWKVPDSSQIVSPVTHSPGSPEELNPPRSIKKKGGPVLKRKGPPKRQVSRGGIILPGDPSFQER